VRYLSWLCAVAVALYAWYATGLAPFSDLAYAALGVPAITALLLYGTLGGFSTNPDVAAYYRSRGTSIRVLPWVVVGAAALGLEIAGLALGGRSKDVPTLSTTLDHLLVTHVGRCLLYLWWFSVGVRAIIPLARLLPRKESS
jgi:hypothetical protein